MKLFGYKNIVLRLDNSLEVEYWAGRLGVTVRRLNEAIVDTGSTNVAELKDHLKKKGFIMSPLTGWLRSFSGSFPGPSGKLLKPKTNAL
jgi:hypothetical protein